MRRIIAFLALALTCGLCPADDIKPLLKDMAKAYKALKSAHVTMDLNMIDDEDDSDSMKIKFDLLFIAPNKQRMEVTDGEQDGAVVLMEGNKIVWYKANSDDTGKAIEEAKDDQDAKPSDDENDNDSSPPVTGMFEDPEKRLSTDKGGAFSGTDLSSYNATWDDKQWTVIQETFAKQGVIRRYYIDPKTHFVWRVTDSDTDADKVFIDCTIRTFEADAKVDPELFKVPG